MSNTLNVMCPAKNEDGDHDHGIIVEIIDYRPGERKTRDYPGTPATWDYDWPAVCPTCCLKYEQKHIDLIIAWANEEIQRKETP